MPGFIDRFLPTAHKNSPDELGKQESEFYKVAWKQAAQILPKPGDFIRDELSKLYGSKAFARMLGLDKLAEKLNTKSNPYFSFHGKDLTQVNAAIAGSEFNKVHWSAKIKAGIQPPGVDTQEPLGRIRLEDVRISEKHGSMVHEHKVFESVSFEDLIITFAFKNSNKKLNVYLDPNSPHYISGMRPQTVNRYAGSNGSKGEPLFPNSELGVSRYQLGISQNQLYGFKCGNIIIGVWVHFSFVFAYPKNDFEPSGTINACKCLPQITFSHFVQNIQQIPTNFSWQDKFKHIIDITNIIPSGTVANSIFVERFKSRIKMVVNVNSSHHINKQTLAGKGYDANFLGDLRATGVNKIPRQFEKILDPVYYGTNNTRNILGLYTDSNNKRNPINRVIGPYSGPVGVALPAWSNIFDYANYDIQTSLQFIAVHGVQTPKLSRYSHPVFNPDSLSKTYPVGSINDGYKVNKFPRQGSYDNIHLHGYLGHYLNENGGIGDLVIHAPICGYCCFHMHWRWSPLNAYVADSFIMKNPVIGKGFNNSNIFKGWDSKTAHQLEGRPLVPHNQHVHIAATTASSSFNPVTEDGNIISQSITSPNSWNGDVINSTDQLENDRKCIWYCSDILALQPNTSHVVLEQGCGYAFEYNYLTASNILNAQTSYSGVISPFDSNYFSYIIKLFKYYNGYSEFYDYISNDILSPGTFIEKTNWRFEMQYRLMRFFNRAEILTTNPDFVTNPMRYVSEYENINNYNKNYFLNEVDQIPTNNSNPFLLNLFSNI